MAVCRLILKNLTHTQRSPLKTHPWPWRSQLLHHHRFSSAATDHHHENPDAKRVSIAANESTDKRKLFSPRSSRRSSLWPENDQRNSLSVFYALKISRFLKPGLRNAVETMNGLMANLSPSRWIKRIKEKDESYNIKYPMPGFSKDDVKITIEDGILFIRAEHKEEEEDSGEDEYWSAASYGYYDTTVRLPEDAKVEEITAEMKDGVLNVIIPKDETKKKQIKENVVLELE
ncbi:hypothetical protein OSB04_004744 [Centaurea solstitialis]|uniref:SHSP domain-containing protein n=1 Tax=Centaurea solstitialis TaxID=347529 RepID=A0AA38TGG1_9ASTR|nr:hypothetical protein OSB04_004744 [Centaurea solstitialis]